MISLGGLLLGLINIAIVVVILLLVGAIVVWFLDWLFKVAVPPNVQKLYIAVVALIALYMLVALLLGLPSVRIIGGHLTSLALVASRPCTVSTINGACQ
jgi:hypothetical protein